LVADAELEAVDEHDEVVDESIDEEAKETDTEDELLVEGK